MNLTNALSYGAIGLGFALAVLAYWLLQREQSRSTARQKMINAIYVYMAFALLLTCGGFVAEYLKSRDEARQQLAITRKVITGMLAAKTGALDRLKTTNRYDPSISEIEQQLRELDDQISKASD